MNNLLKYFIALLFLLVPLLLPLHSPLETAYRRLLRPVALLPLLPTTLLSRSTSTTVCWDLVSFWVLWWLKHPHVIRSIHWLPCREDRALINQGCHLIITRTLILKLALLSYFIAEFPTKNSFIFFNRFVFDTRYEWTSTFCIDICMRSLATRLSIVSYLATSIIHLKCLEVV